MNQRFYSLDVFRGATVALMILVNNPGSWGHIFPPLAHASWHGCSPTDLVFPFFLFAVGNAMAFVMPRLEAKNIFWQKVIKRTVIIFAIGVFLNWFPFIKINLIQTNGHDDVFKVAGKPFESLRILGVLQRIALSYFFASVIVHFFKVRGAFVVSGIVLLLYWFLCVAANPADPFSINGWFGTTIDKAVLGEKHLYHGEGVAFDPEGLMSTFAAIVQVVLGYLAGNYILQKGKTPEMVNGLFVAGCVLVFTGFCWDMVFPINKKIWTSSYAVYTTGLALLILALLIYLIEFKNQKGVWTRFFDVFGKNALFIFALSNLVVKLSNLVYIQNGKDTVTHKQNYTSLFGWFYQHLCKPVFPAEPKIGSLIYALCFIALMWFFAWLMDRKKIYIRV